MTEANEQQQGEGGQGEAEEEAAHREEVAQEGRLHQTEEEEGDQGDGD